MTDALLARANAALARLALEEALELLTQAIALAPDAKALCNRAYCFEQLHRYEAALADARAANALAPSAKGYLRAARALLCLGRFDECQQELSAAAEERPALASDRQLVALFHDAECGRRPRDIAEVAPVAP